MTALLCVIEWSLSDDNLLPSHHAFTIFYYFFFLLCAYAHAQDAFAEVQNMK